MKLRKSDLWKLQDEVYKSRRGDYQLVVTDNGVNVIVWTPTPMDDSKRDQLVMEEIELSKHGRLNRHPWWQDEPEDFVWQYALLYQELFSLMWLHERSDRHNIVVNKHCCLTMVQYNNGVLHAYSRSTDMRNGYYSDHRVLDYLAQTINQRRPDCKVDKIVWYIAVPHEYVNAGIARLKEEDK